MTLYLRSPPRVAERQRRPAGGGVARDHFADQVGRELQVAGAVGRHPQTAELPGQRDAVEVVLARQRRPVGCLVPPPDVALEVHPPRLALPRRVADGPQGNGELGGPSDTGDPGPDLPRPVPVEIEPSRVAAREFAPATHSEPAPAAALVDDLPVVLLTCRAGSEDESVLPVAERIEDHHEAVAVGERRVAPAVVDDDRRRVAVVADDTDIDGVAGVDDADLGLLGRRLALVGRGLAKAGCRSRCAPRGVAQHVAVEDGGVLDGAGGDLLDRERGAEAETGRARRGRRLGVVGRLGGRRPERRLLGLRRSGRPLGLARGRRDRDRREHREDETAGQAPRAADATHAHLM